MRTGLTPSTVQWCRCGRFRGRNLADSVAVRRRFRAGVGVFCQTLIILFAASSHSSAFKNIALPLHDCRRGAGAAPVPSQANAARSPRPKPQSHWGRTRARRTPVPGTPARAPATRGRTAGGSRATSRSRSDGDVAGRAALGPRARPARAGRERRGRDLPRPRAALGQSQDFAYPMYPSRHFHPVRDYQSLVSIIQYIGIQCRHLAA